MGPPETVEPSELWMKLQQMPEPAEVVDFPRKGSDGKPLAKVRIRVLPMDVHDQARLRAREKIRDKPRVHKDDLANGDNIVREVEGDMVARELLWVACQSATAIAIGDKEVYPQLFPSPEAIGEKLTADELAVLFTQYQMVQQKWGPYERSVTGAELDAWISRLAEGGAAFPLARLNSHQLAQLILCLAQRNYTLFQVLESHRSSLPSTLIADLEKLNLDISCFGKLRDESTKTGSSEDYGDEFAVEPEQPISLEDAIEAAKTFE